ncbi:MAG: FecR family protein [Bacteroidales bacterium]|nr:FecR family protein [Bacteroidales bacterium]
MSDFSTYIFKDFISDPSFINYAKGIESEDIIIWEKWLAKNPDNLKTAEEARDFITHLLPSRRVLPRRFIDNEWNRLCNTLDIDNKRVNTSGKPRFKIKVWHYAATIALLISIFGAFFSESIFNQNELITGNEIFVPKGQIRNILLPDNTLVYLNSDTRLSYNTNFGKKNREVFLEGEAYFVVTYNSNKPFIVHTCENEIEVLGTAFNVKAYPDGNIHQISLERGKILISDQNQETYALNPNQTYLLIRNIKSSKAFKTKNVEEYSSWTQGKIILRNHCLSDIAKDLERSHEVIFDIQNKQILRSRYTGEFSRDDDIRKILGIIRLTSPFDFEIAGDTIIIK